MEGGLFAGYAIEVDIDETGREAVAMNLLSGSRERGPSVGVRLSGRDIDRLIELLVRAREK